MDEETVTPSEPQNDANEVSQFDTTAPVEGTTPDVQADDPSQLAADGDEVVEGLEENHVNPVEASPSED